MSLMRTFNCEIILLAITIGQVVVATSQKREPEDDL